MTKRAGKEGRREKDKSPPFFISPSTCHLPPSLKEISKVGIGTGLDEEGWNGTTSCTLNFRPPIFTEQSIASTPSLQPTEENNMTSCMYAFRACAVSFMGLMRLCEMHKKLKEACVQSEQGKNDLHASIRALEKKLRKTEEELALVKTALSNSQVQKKGRVRTAKSSAPRSALTPNWPIMPPSKSSHQFLSTVSFAGKEHAHNQCPPSAVGGKERLYETTKKRTHNLLRGPAHSDVSTEMAAPFPRKGVCDRACQVTLEHLKPYLRHKGATSSDANSVCEPMDTKTIKEVTTKLRILERKVEHWRHKFIAERDAGRALKGQLEREVERGARTLFQKETESQVQRARIEELTRQAREAEKALKLAQTANDVESAVLELDAEGKKTRSLAELEQNEQRLTINLAKLKEEFAMTKSDHLLERERWLRMDAHAAQVQLKLREEVDRLKRSQLRTKC